MKTMEIQVKFGKEDIIYTTKQVKVENKCDVCDGTGKIEYNGKEMRCPECMGRGIFKSNKVSNVVCENPFKISSTKISINSDGIVSVKHKGHTGSGEYLNRSEDNLFSSKEEAQERCDYLNMERRDIRVKDIIISDAFEKSKPSIIKIYDKLDGYRNKGKFSDDIILNSEGILLDGYINYLICRMLNVGTIKVVVNSSITKVSEYNKTDDSTDEDDKWEL